MLKKSENLPFYAKGLHFSCKRCSGCCRFDSGYVFLSEKDLYQMAEAVNLGYKEFITAFCRWIPVENGMAQLSLKEKTNYDCIFWKLPGDTNTAGGCSVYNERPLQCRDFPFWSSTLVSEESWKQTAGECPGMGKGSFYNYNSIKKILETREKEPIISRKIHCTGDFGLKSGSELFTGSPC